MDIIIKFYEKVLGMGEASWQWGRISVMKHTRDGVPTNLPKMKRITRSEALDFIKEHGLVETHRDGSGIVYDTPDLAFQKKYKGLHVPGNLAD